MIEVYDFIGMYKYYNFDMSKIKMSKIYQIQIYFMTNTFKKTCNFLTKK